MPEKLKQQLIYATLVVLFIAVIVLIYIGDFSSHKKEPLEKNTSTVNQSSELKIVEPLEVFVDVNESAYSNGTQSAQDNNVANTLNEVLEVDIVEANKSIKEEVKKSTFSCLDCELGSYRLSSTCKKRLQHELNKNSHIASLELIGVVDRHDFVALEKLQMNTKEVNYIRTLASEGLGFLRVNEDTTLNYVNYVIKSSEDRGFVLNFYD